MLNPARQSALDAGSASARAERAVQAKSKRMAAGVPLERQPLDIEANSSSAGVATPRKYLQPRTGGWKAIVILSIIVFCLVVMQIASLALIAVFGSDIREVLSLARKSVPYYPHEPPVPGIMPGKDRPHIVLAQDIDYPPYAYLGSATEEFDVDGFGHDIALRLHEVCDINVTVVESKWSNCWGSGEIGQGLINGWYHGCMTYTHTVGQRNRFLEFSEPILNLNKPAGLISRLRADGTPVINSTSSLQGVRVVDVVGWAPTADGLHFVTNFCTNQKFSGFQIVAPTYSTGNANEDALLTLLNGDADAMWVYADQAKNYRCSPGVDGVSWNCTRWTDGFGKNFAYVHTGMYTYAYGGTTLSMSKRGSGLKQILDPCITKFKDTKSYYDICRDNGLDHSCYKNAFFPAQEEASYATPPYETKTNELTTTCADGYCPCSS